VIGWTLERVREALGAEAAGPLEGSIRGVSVDTRTMEPGALYVAIRGPRHDGHEFVRQAAERGAAAAVVSRGEAAPAGLPALTVSDTVAALGRLASAYRATLGAKVAGVTGSCGKTSTCRLIDAALSGSRRGTAARRSFNNAIGVPLTLLGAREEDAYVVCEIGTSGPGEIEPLSRLAAPDVALITLIGRAHLEKLIDVEGVRREKTRIYAGLREGGLALGPSSAPRVREDAPAGVRYETVGVERDADHRIRSVRTERTGTSFELDGERYRVPMAGEHSAVNAGFAVVAARELGADPASIAAGLEKARAPEMRFETSLVAGATIVNDAYNANPESVAAALRAFAGTCAGQRRIVVLGDMLEMGASAEAAHEEAIGLARDLAFDAIALVGPQMRAAAGRLNVRPAAAVDSVGGGGAEEIARLVRAGDAVLLKGSRGMALERVLEAWRASEPTGAGA